ncbi:MAG: hypothetical protein DBP02_17665 [gamma proteobacterium symbiont of Ctena orbiculata]|nr:MAG: hypothetical protein DBP02_17665 [gamma proteobacterium symbiont of Ctena orbiculata]PUB84117.1 MAG: hypothetical protein DBP01_15115 [gamma proteobacterium symbiont of Ctena orbiculata]
MIRACGPHPSGAAAARRSARLRRLSNQLFEVGGSNTLDSTFARLAIQVILEKMARPEGLFGPVALTPAGPPLRGVLRAFGAGRTGSLKSEVRSYLNNILKRGLLKQTPF